jgi:hypothetical protein
VSSGANEVSAGTSTIQWRNNAIDNVTSSWSTDDTINGNNAANLIWSEGGDDNIDATFGDDYIVVNDGGDTFGDTVLCGDGTNDTVYYDVGVDTVIGCENLNEEP